MTTLRRLKFRTPAGEMKWEDFKPWFQRFIEDELFKTDVRDALQEPLYNRGAALPTILTYVGDAGRAVSERLLGQVNAGNKGSVQNIQPLTSTDEGGGTARIDIAAHTVRFDFGLVSYNAGSITGLANSTLYYVYADDPEYAGGAVSYSATTSQQTVTANSGRHYVGKITTDAPAGGGTSGGWGGAGGGGGFPLP